MSELPANFFQRPDESSDEHFYAQPRLVTHIDNRAIAAVTELYRQLFPANGAVLDLMSSWVSHLPPEVDYRRVVGLGMNRVELDANSRLHERVVQNLNETPQLPFTNGEFDAAAICVSVQYLTQPTAVFHEIARVLRPGAPLVVTFSNRCFPTKAVRVWQARDDEGHMELVRRYFAAGGHWIDVEVRVPRRAAWGQDPLYAVIGRRARGATE